MGQRTIIRQMLHLEPLIRATFAQPRIDYRGRQIDLDHVLEYFYCDLYREAEIIELILTRCGGKQLSRILNVGVGYGFLDTVLKTQYGCCIEGCELPDNIPIYSALLHQCGIPVLSGGLGIGDWVVEDESCDLIIFGEVFEHLRIAPLRALRLLYAALRPGGKLLLTTPNIACLANIIKLASGHNILQLFPEDDINLAHITDELVHIREYTLDEVKMLLAKANFKIEQAYHSQSWDCVNPYLENYRYAEPIVRVKSWIRAGLTRVLPAYRREMIFLSRKP